MIAEVRSNSALEQKVQLKIEDGTHGITNRTFEGSGENNNFGIARLPPGTFKLTATFTYGGDDYKKKKPSELHSGGPHKFGAMNVMTVFAENGDDEDFNDVQLQVRGVGGGRS